MAPPAVALERVLKLLESEALNAIPKAEEIPEATTPLTPGFIAEK
jgi:hypothetical protein